MKLKSATNVITENAAILRTLRRFPTLRISDADAAVAYRNAPTARMAMSSRQRIPTTGPIARAVSANFVPDSAPANSISAEERRDVRSSCRSA